MHRTLATESFGIDRLRTLQTMVPEAIYASILRVLAGSISVIVEGRQPISNNVDHHVIFPEDSLSTGESHVALQRWLALLSNPYLYGRFASASTAIARAIAEGTLTTFPLVEKSDGTPDLDQQLGESLIISTLSKEVIDFFRSEGPLRSLLRDEFFLFHSSEKTGSRADGFFRRNEVVASLFKASDEQNPQVLVLSTTAGQLIDPTDNSTEGWKDVTKHILRDLGLTTSCLTCTITHRGKRKKPTMILGMTGFVQDPWQLPDHAIETADNFPLLLQRLFYAAGSHKLPLPIPAKGCRNLFARMVVPGMDPLTGHEVGQLLIRHVLSDTGYGNPVEKHYPTLLQPL